MLRKGVCGEETLLLYLSYEPKSKMIDRFGAKQTWKRYHPVSVFLALANNLEAFEVEVAA